METIENENLDPSFKRELKMNEFFKLKSKVIKKFPNAKIKIDNNKKYYVIDKTGIRIIPEYLMIPNSNNVFDAWNNVLIGKQIDNILERNKRGFLKDKESGKIQGIINNKLKEENKEHNNLVDCGSTCTFDEENYKQIDPLDE